MIYKSYITIKIKVSEITFTIAIAKIYQNKVAILPC